VLLIITQLCADHRQAESGQDPHQRMVNDKLTASELATTALVALPPLVLLRDLADMLRSCRHQAFPVTTDTKAAYQSGVPPPHPSVQKSMSWWHVDDKCMLSVSSSSCCDCQRLVGD
jgi:hypothetical protein